MAWVLVACASLLAGGGCEERSVAQAHDASHGPDAAQPPSDASAPPGDSTTPPTDGATGCATDERLVEGECRAEPLPCGDPEPQPTCTSDLDQADCLAVDGYYECSPYGACYCLCPAGDHGCPCWDYLHCQGTCMAEDLSQCVEGGVGTCSEHIVYAYIGCHCYFEHGAPTQLCAD